MSAFLYRKDAEIATGAKLNKAAGLKLTQRNRRNFATFALKLNDMPVKILMVCLGNICRSPLAEGILASKLPTEQFTVESAGTGHWHVGSAPDKRSIEVARHNGLDISNQRGRQFSAKDFDEFDHIFVMDGSNYRDVLELAKSDDHRAKVRFVLDEIFPGENVDVPDPYYGLENGFHSVYAMLDETCEAIAQKLLRQHS